MSLGRRAFLRGGAAALILGRFKLRIKRPTFRGRVTFYLPQKDGSVLVGYKGIERYAPGIVYCPHPPFPLQLHKSVDIPHPRTAHMKPSDFVKENNLARFLFLRQGQAFYYVRKLGTSELYMFPVSLADVGDATLNSVEKALTMMRYIRLAIHDGTMVLKPQTEFDKAYNAFPGMPALKDMPPSGVEFQERHSSSSSEHETTGCVRHAEFCPGCPMCIEAAGHVPSQAALDSVGAGGE